MNGAKVNSGTDTQVRDNAILTQAAQAATDAGQLIAVNYQGLTFRERLHVASAFRRQLIPPGKRGRKRSGKITAAYLDWKDGLRGVALYRKHIHGWERHSEWRRKVEARGLINAIHARKRRERKVLRSDEETELSEPTIAS